MRRFQFWPRPRGAVAGVIAAGLLAAAGCGGVTPLGPTTDAPRPHALGSPIVLRAMSVKYPTPAGQCPAGFGKLTAPMQGAACYRPLGAPATFTSAAVAPGPTVGPASPSNAPPSGYSLLISLPSADRAELTAVTTQAYNAHGAVDVSVAGQTWALPLAEAPLTQGDFEISLPTQSEVLKLERMLTPAG